MRCYVEPSPSGGYFVRLRGEPAPLSRHDTEEEAEAAAAAYERGLQRPASELVVLDDGSDVLVRAQDDGIAAYAEDVRVGLARYVPDGERPHVADASVRVDGAWRRRGLGRRLLRRLAAQAAEQRIRVFACAGEEVAVAQPAALERALREAAGR